MKNSMLSLALMALLVAAPVTSVTAADVSAPASAADIAAIVAQAQKFEADANVPQNLPAALRLYQRAADLGSAQAAYKVGIFYRDGLGVESDWDKFLKYMALAAERGDPNAAYEMAMSYAQTEFPEEIPEYCLWIKKAAELGHPEAIGFAGELYFSQGDWKNAYPLLMKAAQQGNVRAQAKLAELMLNPEAGYFNRQLAHEYLVLAAEKQYSPAYFILGRDLMTAGNAAEAQQGFALVKQSMKRGYVEAAVYLAEKGYANELPMVPPAQLNRRTADWAKHAADLGMVVGNRILGLCYLEGKGVERDIKKARENLKMACDYGDEESCKVVKQFQ